MCIRDRLIAAGEDTLCAEGRFDVEKLLACVLAGGDDYELVFTAPVAARQAVQAAAAQAQTRVTRIGQIEAASGAPAVRLVDAAGAPVLQQFASFDHFA